MIETQVQRNPAKKDAILVFESADGSVEHCFCTEPEATERLARAVAKGSGGSTFVCDGLDAELVYAVAPNVRERVEEAKRKLNYELTIRDALSRHGVPVDRDLRIKVKKAIDDLRESVFRPVL